MNALFVALEALELDDAIGQREERPVTADTDVVAGVNPGAELTHDDRASGNGLATEFFDAPPLSAGVATVARASLTFFMCHFSTLTKKLYASAGAVMPVIFNAV